MIQKYEELFLWSKMNEDYEFEIEKENRIIQRCSQSIIRKEPYDAMLMQRQIKISLSKISTMRMYQKMNKSGFAVMSKNAILTIREMIENRKKLYTGVDKFIKALLKDDKNDNSESLKNANQTLLELDEQLELLVKYLNEQEGIQCSPSISSSTNQHTTRNSLIAVSGSLNIRITGLSSIRQNPLPRPGNYAAERLLLSVNAKKKFIFKKVVKKRKKYEPSNDYIVVIRVGGTAVHTIVWNEKKTMYWSDEEVINLHNHRSLDVEVYHADNRSLCALGTVPLETFLENNGSEYSSSTHRHVPLIPDGVLFCQTSYSNPEQILEKRLDEKQEDCWKHISSRKSGTIVSKRTQYRYKKRAAITPSIFVKPPTIDSIDGGGGRQSFQKYKLCEELLGVGAFGTVKLAQRFSDLKLFAVKILEKDPKSEFFETSELEILKRFHNQFICELIDSYEHVGRLHMIMEFCEGGDLHTHLSRTIYGFNIEQVRYFAACIILAVEYIHGNLYVHRDLKTENIMLTRSGNLKLIDFGLCRKLKERGEKMFNIVGTTTHLAAEIHRREPYGIEMDWWAVGVSLYQLRTRNEPFYGSREEEMVRNSRVNQIPVFHDLLKKLLNKDPEQRIGYRNTNEVKSHGFFPKHYFENVYSGSITPPYKPLLKPGLDLEYFEGQCNMSYSPSSSSSNSSGVYSDHQKAEVSRRSNRSCKQNWSGSSV